MKQQWYFVISSNTITNKKPIDLKPNEYMNLVRTVNTFLGTSKKITTFTSEEVQKFAIDNGHGFVEYLDINIPSLAPITSDIPVAVRGYNHIGRY